MKKIAFVLFLVLAGFAVVFFILKINNPLTMLEPYSSNSQIKSMQEEIMTVPLQTQLGQAFMIGHWADRPVASTTSLIEKYQLGGVIIMSAPENPQDIIEWTTQWNAVSEVPLLIAIDQEGGPVTRLKSAAFTQVGQREIRDSKQAYAVGVERGKELSNLGINMNFAPVLDSALNPTSFMYSRTFPENTDQAALAASLVDGMTASDVIAVVKHFPGHDDTSVDSHQELPVVTISKSELNTFTQSFTDIIQQNPPHAIMTAHVQFPEIDSLPATLSTYFLTTYLKDELGYTGLVITDDMSMDAIDTLYSTKEASRLALEAGADIILLAAEPTDIENIFPFLMMQSDTSPLLKKRVTESYGRNISLKESLTK